tara:strand:- start:96 stop:476 length:381 start_codon:yes stop_codon:yes gene_type:complete
LNDLDICKRVARIEGVNYTVCINAKLYPPRDAIYFREYEGNRPAPIEAKKLKEYNPLTDDALCFKLMIKYGVELSPMFNGCWCATVAQAYTFDEQIDYRLCSTGLDENPKMAICLAIIELKKRKVR